MDKLAGIGERLAVLRRRHRAELGVDADEDVDAAQAVIMEVVSFADSAKLPDELRWAIARALRSVAAKHAGRAVSGLGGTSRGQATTRTM